MVKYCVDKYPIGSFPGQKSAGRYVDGIYYSNMKILAESITNDMTHLLTCCSSTYEVGAGKSAFMQQTGEQLTELVNEIHGTKLVFGKRNIVFKPRDLISRAFEIAKDTENGGGKYSTLILDEWDDAHYWSELAIALRQFFRKCRQLNLFIIVICPNFFQLPMNYAISRSICLIDVRFEGNFERGYFRFYNFNRKKQLYIKGKKTQDYECVKPNFIGRFTKGYAINEQEYRDMKYKDMLDSEEDTTPKATAYSTKVKILQDLMRNKPDITMEELAKIFSVSQRTIYRWINEKNEVFAKENEEFDTDNGHLNYNT